MMSAGEDKIVGDRIFQILSAKRAPRASEARDTGWRSHRPMGRYTLNSLPAAQSTPCT